MVELDSLSKMLPKNLLN